MKKGQIPKEKSNGHSHFYGSQSHRPRRDRWQFIATINWQNRPQRDWRFCKGILYEEYLSEPSNRDKPFLQGRKLCWHNRQHFQAGRRCKLPPVWECWCLSSAGLSDHAFPSVFCLEGERTQHDGNTFAINHHSIQNIKGPQKHLTCFPFQVRVRCN